MCPGVCPRPLPKDKGRAPPEDRRTSLHIFENKGYFTHNYGTIHPPKLEMSIDFATQVINLMFFFFLDVFSTNMKQFGMTCR